MAQGAIALEHALRSSQNRCRLGSTPVNPSGLNVFGPGETPAPHLNHLAGLFPPEDPAQRAEAVTRIPADFQLVSPVVSLGSAAVCWPFAK